MTALSYSWTQDWVPRPGTRTAGAHLHHLHHEHEGEGEGGHDQEDGADNHEVSADALALLAGCSVKITLLASHHHRQLSLTYLVLTLRILL